MGCLPRTAIVVEWSPPKPMTQVLHAGIRRDRKAFFGTQKITSEFYMPDNVLDERDSYFWTLVLL